MTLLTHLCAGEDDIVTPLCAGEDGTVTPLCAGEDDTATHLCAGEDDTATHLCAGEDDIVTHLCAGEDGTVTPLCAGNDDIVTHLCAVVAEPRFLSVGEHLPQCHPKHPGVAGMGELAHLKTLGGTPGHTATGENIHVTIGSRQIQFVINWVRTQYWYTKWDI